jgi:YD repeat-containing protein
LVVVCEGEKSADAAAKIFPESVCVTSPGGSEASAKADWRPLAGRRVVVWPDADEPGTKYANKVTAILVGLSCEVSKIDAMALGSIAPDGSQRKTKQGWDAADAVDEWTDLDALRQAFETSILKSKEAPAASKDISRDSRFDQEEIARLAKLSPLEYDRVREQAAKTLSIRVQTLDAQVKAQREKFAAKEAEELCVDIEPWPYAVKLAELLNEVRATILRFIVCELATATAATLWICFTWIIDHVQVAPLAMITAPERRCGKTQFLDVIGRLSKRALFASNISPAATFRVSEANAPTLVIDEADSFMRENEALRG